MSEPSDRDRWLHGIVERYERPLCQYAFGVLQNAELAREAVQDTFLRLCRQERARVEGLIPAWLFRVCRNRSLDIVRKEKRMHALTDQHAAALEAEGPAPAEAAAVNDGVSRVLQLLAELPANQREVIRLKFQQGLSYKEIADVTRLSVSNVGFLLHTGIKTLRREMTAQQGA